MDRCLVVLSRRGDLEWLRGRIPTDLYKICVRLRRKQDIVLPASTGASAFHE